MALSLACKSCKELITGEGEDELVARVQAHVSDHARAHGREHTVSASRSSPDSDIKARTGPTSAPRSRSATPGRPEYVPPTSSFRRLELTESSSRCPAGGVPGPSYAAGRSRRSSCGEEGRVSQWGCWRAVSDRVVEIPASISRVRLAWERTSGWRGEGCGGGGGDDVAGL